MKFKSARYLFCTALLTFFGAIAGTNGQSPEDYTFIASVQANRCMSATQHPLGDLSPARLLRSDHCMQSHAKDLTADHLSVICMSYPGIPNRSRFFYAKTMPDCDVLLQQLIRAASKR